MLDGFYTAASGILMQERNLNVLTNNIANVRTPGFKASRLISSTFEHELLTRIEKGNTGAIGKGAPIRIVSEVPTRFNPDLLEQTGRAHDIAINGEGFFNVLVTPKAAAEETTPPAEGEEAAPAAPAEPGEPKQYLTRNGNFDVDEEGFLILRGQGQVLGEKGPIQLTSSNFTVEDNGEIYDGDGKLVDRLLVTLPGPEAPMTRNPNGMFSTANMEENVPITEGTTLVQGYTEKTNIDLNREYTLVMEAQRSLQAAASALQIIDRINQKSAVQIASL